MPPFFLLNEVLFKLSVDSLSLILLFEYSFIGLEVPYRPYFIWRAIFLYFSSVGDDTLDEDYLSLRRISPYYSAGEGPSLGS